MSKLSSTGKVWDALRLACLNRDGWGCAYCGKHLEGADATADHIVPKAAGGKDEMSNLLAACVKCNGMKQDKMYERTLWLHPLLLAGVRL